MKEMHKSSKIDLDALKTSRKLSSGLIAPASEIVNEDIAQDHSADPIKSLDDIDKISRFLINSERWRDNMLFIVGINFGLRFSDLRMLRFCNLINDNFTFKETFAVFEKKTRNTRKRKKNRYITINDAVMESVTLYLEHTPNVCLSDYMFKSVSNNRTMYDVKPMSLQSANFLFAKLAKDLDLTFHFSTHTLRKTFCYHQMVMSNNDSRKLLLLQKMMNHSSPAQTLDYIGITSEEIEAAYKELNLGYSKYNYLCNTDIIETEADSVNWWKQRAEIARDTAQKAL